MIDWRVGTQAQGVGDSIYWDVRDGLVRHTIIIEGTSGVVYLNQEEARNMMCGLAHVLGELRGTDA